MQELDLIVKLDLVKYSYLARFLVWSKVSYYVVFGGPYS